MSKQQEKRAEDHLQSLFDKIEKRQNQNHEPNNVVNEEASCSLSEGHEESSLYEKMWQIKLQKIREQEQRNSKPI